jgi:hypothetical protein
VAQAAESRWCIRGHDTWEVGRDRYHYCRECKREASRRSTERRRQGEPLYVPVEPILRLIDRLAIAGCPACGIGATGRCPHTVRLAARRYAARWGGDWQFHARRIYRWRTGQVRRTTVMDADQWCLVLGSHLALAYPELYR